MISLGRCRVRTGTRAWLPAPCVAPIAWLGGRRARCGLCARQGEPRRAGLAIHGGSSPQESSPPAPAVPGSRGRIVLLQLHARNLAEWRWRHVPLCLPWPSQNYFS
jgi:hypothetical protein